MLHIIGIALWALIPGFIAKKKGRNFWIWYFFSFLISPLFTMIITFFLSDISKNDEAKLEHNDDGKIGIKIEPSSQLYNLGVSEEEIDEFYQKYPSLRRKEKKAPEENIEIIKPKSIKNESALLGINNLDNAVGPHINVNDVSDKTIVEAVDIVTTEKANSTESNEEFIFCRKCRTQLLSDSEFCHKCGCEKVH